jgi:hypothetical protein
MNPEINSANESVINQITIMLSSVVLDDESELIIPRARQLRKPETFLRAFRLGLLV